MPLTLTPGQLSEINRLVADDQNTAHPYSRMYAYIAEEMKNGHIKGYSEDQLYWFKEAAGINADAESNPATFFIRDVTRIGMGLSSNSDPRIQNASNAIGKNVFDQITGASAIPDFGVQLNDDISAAINDAGLTIGKWGGSFYYWDAAYTDPATGDSTTVGAYILTHSDQESLFVTNTAQAITDTVEKFGIGLFDDPSFNSAVGKAFANFSSLPSALVGLELVAQVASDAGQDVARRLLQVINSDSSGGSGIVAGLGDTKLAGGSGSDVLFGGQGVGGISNDTLVGGSGADSFVFALPTSGSATETIESPTGKGQVAVVADGQINVLGGSQDQPLVAVQGAPDTWEDSQGTLYSFSGSSDELAISGGVLGSGGEIVVENFNLAAATQTVAEGGGADGYLGFHLANAITLTVGATAGVDPPPPDFIAGSSQSYTVSVDAPSNTPQTVVMSLSGVSASEFQILTTLGAAPLNADGTFSITIPAGETNVSFSLENTGDVGGGATLQLAATLTDPSNPAETVSSNSLTQNYVEPAQDPFSDSQSSSLYYSGPITVPNGVTTSYGDSYGLYGTAPAGTPVTETSGNAYIGSNGDPNHSITGGPGNDTIVADFGFRQTDGGVDVISGNGGEDDILVPYDDQPYYWGNGVTAPDGSFTARIYANSPVDLATAIADANSESATGAQGDLIASTAPTSTIVGGSGNDLILDSGDGVVVAGSGDDTIVGGTGLRVITANWYPGGNDQLYPGVTWSTSYVDNQLEVLGGSISTIGINTPQSGYEGNLASDGQTLGHADNTIFGGAGKDLIILSNGNNEVHLGKGNSTVLGGMGQNTITGGEGDDSIIGGGGSDYIAAGTGNDAIFGQGGNNTLIGGAGNDTLVAGQGNAGFATSETGDNYVQAGSGNTVILGAGGSDTLIGGSGNDTIEAGAGNEFVVGGSGNESINGGAGNDTLQAGGDGNDTIFAGSGSTTISGGGGVDYLHGGSGSDVIYSGDGGQAETPTQIQAGSGNTTIYGGNGVDRIDGGDGNDVIYAGDGGTAAAPTSVEAGSGNTTIYGGNGTDEILGGAGVDVLYAGNGGTDANPNVVTAGTGTATLYGGAGASVLNDSVSGTDLLVAGSGDTSLYGVGSDTLVAGSGSDYLSGTGNDTYIFGADSGADEVANTGAADVIQFSADVASNEVTFAPDIGSGGQTSLIMDDGGGSITVDNGLSSGSIAAVSFSGSSPLSLAQAIQQAAAAGNAVNSVISGTNGNLIFDAASGDSVTGGSGQDTLSTWGNGDSVVAGSGGNLVYAEGTGDIVRGGSGNDTLDAIGAHTTLVGGTGNALFNINDTSDVVSVAGDGGHDSIVSSVSYTLPTHVDTLTLSGTANLSATGNNDADNLLTANSGNDTLTAGSGNDTLVSGSGVDVLVGGTGPDTFEVNNSADVIQPGSTGGQDTIYSSVNYTLTAHIGTLTLTGTGNLTATDSYGNATITGNAGNDTLTGGAGTDKLIAGSGVDTLVAGTGRTTFVVNNTSDVIQGNGSSGSDTVQSSVSYTLEQHIDNLTLTGSGDLVGRGNSDASNYIVGNAGNDTLIAGSGSDTLVAGTGADTLVAGVGTDVLQGQGGDTFELDSGFGSSKIVTGSGVSTVQFGAGISATDLTLGLAIGTDGNPALVIQDGGGAATIDGGLTGSIGSFDFADGSNLTLAQLLSAAHVSAATVPGAHGNVLLNGAAGATLQGDATNDTLFGGGAGDSLEAGTGNQQLYGIQSGDLLVGGSGDDTLYGGTGNETLVGGSGNTVMYGGAGDDSYRLTQGGTATIYANSAARIQAVYLPTGMTFSDFTSYQGPNGDLILQSLDGSTSAIIKGYYSNGTASKAWLLLDGSGTPQFLASVAGPPQSASSYQQKIDQMRQAYAADVPSTLNGLGLEGATLTDSNDTIPAGNPSQDYHFTGTAAHDIVMQSPNLTLSGSETDHVTTTTTQHDTTETYTVPVYSTVTRSAQTVFIPNSSGLTDHGDLSSDGSTFGLTPVYDSAHNLLGYNLQIPAETSVVQTGTRTATKTVTSQTTITHDTRGFTAYNITGDGGNDVITSGPTFAGTVNVNDRSGNVSYVDLGGDSSDAPNNGITNVVVRNGLPTPGAFIEAGAGAETIVGTGNADVIAAGDGVDDLTGWFGSTFYVPMEGTSTDTINVLGAPFYGNAPFAANTLVLPDGITPGDLTYRLFSSPPGADLNASGWQSSWEALQITYKDSTVLIYFDAGPGSPYLGGPGSAPNWAGAGSDFTDGINRFQFSDGTVLTRNQVLAMAGPAVSAANLNPVVTALNPTVQAETPIAASELFSSSDPTGNGMRLYQIQVTPDGGGHFVLTGSAEPVGQWFYVAADQLANLSFVGNYGANTQIQVAGFDGVTWSNFTTFNVNIPSASQVAAATGPNQLVEFFGANGPDTVVGGFDGDTLQGGTGQDTFLYERGGGAETIYTTPSNDTIQFGAGISPASMTFSIANDGALVLGMAGGDNLNIENFNPTSASQPGIASVHFADGSSMPLLQLLGQSSATGTSGSITNPDGSTTDYTFTPGGTQTYVAENFSASGQLTTQFSLTSDSSTEVDVAPDGSGSTTIVTDYDNLGRFTSQDITSPDGSTDNTAYGYNSDGSSSTTEVQTAAGGGGTTTIVSDYNPQGRYTAVDITNPDGSTDDSTYAYNADGTSIQTEILTPAGGGGITTVLWSFGTGNQVLSRDQTNPDGSTDDTTYDYHSDGTYRQTEVVEPADGSSSTTTVSDYDNRGNLVDQNAYMLSSDGAYTDTWSKQDGSHGSYWWNTSSREYEETWYNADGSSWTDDYQYATGGSPTATGISFTETYTASDGSHGTRQFDATAGTVDLSWYSSATGSLSGTTTDAGFIGLQTDGELTNTTADPTFFNPAVSPSFQAFLSGH